MNAIQIFLVGLGGGLGAIARDKLSSLILHHVSYGRFPLATFVVNVLGCFVAGFLSGLIERQEWFTLEIRIFLMTGVLGGFTTFSAFGVETIFLIRRGELLIAIVYMVLSLLCSLAGVWLGIVSVPHRMLK